jgi:tetratricopeptide (TPR) repeat protein
MLAHLKRGDAYRRRGELHAALRDLSEASRLDDTAPQPLELLGDVNAALGEHRRAADFYERYVQLDDRASRVLYKLALAYTRQEEAAKAATALNRLIALDDRLPEAHYLLGLTLRRLRRDDDALRALARAIAQNAALIAAREERAALYAERGRARESLDELEAIAALEPQRPERYIALALGYARFGRRESAIATLGRAAERYPDASAVYTALGRIWLDAAASSQDSVAVVKAVQALRPVAGRADATSETLALYGRALIAAGNPRDAERVLLQAVRRSPVDPAAFRHLADAARRLGHGPLAVDAQAKYIALTGAS